MNVYMFWQGSVSLYEQACMLSFVKNGFELSVYSYDENSVFPEGVKLCDARQILPQNLSTAYTQAGKKASLASFSNRFRYKFLFDIGGIWVDADMLCFKPKQEYQILFESDKDKVIVARQDPQQFNTALIAAPAEHPVLKAMLLDVEQRGFEIERWGMIGPELMTEYVNQNPETTKILDKDTFYPIHYLSFIKMLLPEFRDECKALCKNSYGLHLWNEMFQKFAVPKNMLPPEGSFLYEYMVSLLGECAPALPSNTVWELHKGGLAQAKLRTLKSQLGQKFQAIINEF